MTDASVYFLYKCKMNKTHFVSFPILLSALILMLVLALPSGQANRFPSLLYSQIAWWSDDENFVISPTSTYLALGLLFFGMGEDNELAYILSTVGKGPIFTKSINIVNRLYVSDRITILPYYQESVTDVLGPSAQTIDFSSRHSAIDHINSYVKKKTSMKVENFLDPSLLRGNINLAIASAAYFNGKWKFPFYLRNTQKLPFYSTRVYLTDMMYTRQRLLYGELPSLDARGVELPYKDNKLSMLVLLPNDQNDNLHRLNHLLTEIDLTKVSSNFTNKIVELELPKFNVSYKVPLENVLKPLGIKSIFENPDLNVLTHSKVDNLKVDIIMHESVIEVDEEGTMGEALNDNDARSDELEERSTPIEFHVNHPFVFVIKDQNHVYFVGRIVEP